MHRLRTIGRLRAGGSGFNPLTLFAAGEQGAWYDPSDLSTQFQDSAGTIPVTTVGQPVGAVVDKHVGLTQVQATVDQFTLTPAGTTPPTVSSATSFLGENCVSVTFPALGAGGFTVSNASGNSAGSGAQFNIVLGRFYRSSYRIALSRALTGAEQINVYTTGSTGSGFIQLTSATPSNVWQDYVGATTLVAASNGQDSAYAYASTALAAPVTVYIRRYSVLESAGNTLVQATTTSRPTLQQDASGYWYWNFDGVDDSWATAATADFSATDKVSVFCGVYKGSDAASGLVCELTADLNSNAGAFYVVVPQAATSTNAGFGARGSVVPGSVAAAGGFAVSTAKVLTGTGDIAGASQTIRLNGVAGTPSASSIGTGNFSNSTLYVGRRGGSALPLNGRIYQLIARGALSSAAQITAAERFVGSKMGIAL